MVCVIEQHERSCRRSLLIFGFVSVILGVAMMSTSLNHQASLDYCIDQFEVVHPKDAVYYGKTAILKEKKGTGNYIVMIDGEQYALAPGQLRCKETK